MEEIKNTANTSQLKKSRWGPGLKSSVKARRNSILSNGNGMKELSNETSEKSEDIPPIVEKDDASMSVRNKEICRLHMEETNSINNAQNPDGKIKINLESNVKDTNKDTLPTANITVKEEIDHVSISNKVDETGDKVSDSTLVTEVSSKNDTLNHLIRKKTSKEVESSVKEDNSEKDENSVEKENCKKEENFAGKENPDKEVNSVQETLNKEKKSDRVENPNKEENSSKEENFTKEKNSTEEESSAKEENFTKEGNSKEENSSREGNSANEEKSSKEASPVKKENSTKKENLAKKENPKKEKNPEKEKNISKEKRKVSAETSSPENQEKPDDEALSSESEEFYGFDSELTEKSVKAKIEFIEKMEVDEVEEKNIVSTNLVSSSADVKSSQKNVDESNVTSSAVASTPKSESSSSKAPPSTGKRNRKVVVDLTDPIYRKPFEFGWKRELVYRTINDAYNRRQGDIYYYSPSGKKVRSSKEVMDHITDPELSVDNFTFFKEPLGINDPDKEIIRDARIRSSKDFAVTPPPKVTKLPKAKAAASPVAPVSSPPTPKPASTATPKLVVKTPSSSSGGLKVKFTGIKSGSTVAKSSISKSKPAKVKKRKASSGGSSELEIGMLPPMWNSSEVKSESLTTARSWSPPTVSESTKSVGKKRSAEKQIDDKKISPPAKKMKAEIEQEPPAQVASVSTVSAVTPQSVVTTTTPNSLTAPLSQSHFFMMNLAAGYSTLMHIFRYLNLKELLSASRVCRLWHDVALKPNFWQTVRMKNTQVTDWNGFANALIKHDTKHLDLRKMLVGSKPEEVKANWLEFYEVIGRVKSLKRIELCRCLSSVIENLAKHVPHLESLTATTIKSSSLSLEPLGVLSNLSELRLKGMSGLELSFTHLSNLSELKLLSITGIKNLNDESSTALGSLTKLETLEIGDCTNIYEQTVTESIPKLVNLKRLRLEKGQNSVPLISQLLEAASKLPQLEILELINFDVKPGFDVALGKCTNIKSLLMIPTYITQSATTNHIVMIGVSRLASTLKQFVWGLTLELLRVTDLFIDQCETAKNSPAQSPNTNGNNAINKKGKGDSIPILKPLIDTLEDGHDIKDPIPLTPSVPSKVDILPIPKLRKVLSNVLPTTEIRILKIPFSSTWRQTLV